MNNQLISVIMSTYNETIEELNQSINSILTQSHKDLEFIIVNDNPSNLILSEYLESLTDSRVKVYKNDKNMGLVDSLNIALKYANGNYVARMDADDISLPYRLEHQLNYLLSNNFDMVGSYLQLIDENGCILKEVMKFPSSEKKIRKCISWGSCLPHPSWLLKKSVYDKLGGYREVPSCEDYDFILRALVCKDFRLGNIPEVCLKYRVRNKGISKSNKYTQYLLTKFLSKNYNENIIASKEDIDSYLNSNRFASDVNNYKAYNALKKQIKNISILNMLTLLKNRYFYYDIIEKIYLKYREYE